MTSLLLSTLLKVALPVAAVGLVLFAARKHGVSWRDDLGFKVPQARTWLIWLLLWGAWLVAGEAFTRVFALEQAQPWPSYPMLIVVLRILAIGLMGPLAEETLMRGLVLHLLQRSRLGIVGAIVLSSAAWAAMHYSYGLGTVLLIACDGLLLGMARYKSGSLWVPISMHVLGNLFSIYQSLAT